MSKKGFSLVELSIAIIVVGLLLAGISAGTSLIKEAEIKNVIRETQKLGVAYNTFIATYEGIPGDFGDAQTYFTGCADTASNCNGDGNGNINASNSATDEVSKALIHLMASELYQKPIPFPLSDMHDGSTFDYAFDSSVDQAKYMFGGRNTSVSGRTFYSSFFTDSAAVYLGTYEGGTSFTYVSAAIKPLDAFKIDQKIDDGAYSGTNAAGATSGKFRASPGYLAAGCHSSGNYTVTSTSKDCVIGLAVE